MDVVILGIDPGIANCGVCVIDPNDKGQTIKSLDTLTTDKNVSPAARRHELLESITQMVDALGITQMAWEAYYHHRGTMHIPKLIGLLEHYCYIRGMPYTEVNPAEVKAYKHVHKRAITQIRCNPNVTQHEIDACCVAEIVLSETSD